MIAKLIKSFVFILFLFSDSSIISQEVIINKGVAINDVGSNPQAGHILDIQSTDQGILIPRVDLSNPSFSKSPVNDAIESTLVYNIGTNSEEGYYYWSGNKWQKLATAEDAEIIPPGLIMLSNSKPNYPGYEYTGRIIIPQNTDVLGIGTGAWISTENIANYRCYSPSTVAWGNQVISWSGKDGGSFADYENTGGVYDLANDSWTLMNTTNAPDGRYGHATALDSTSGYMAIWGGVIAGDGVNSPVVLTNTGAEYFIGGDSWSPLSASPLSARQNHTGVGTGGFQYIFWGGTDGNGTYYNDGAMYTSAGWTMMANSPLSPRADHTAIFADGKLYIFGGLNATTSFSDGAIYDLASDSWTLMSATGSPQGRYLHAMVFSGSDIIIFGGRKTVGSFSSHSNGYRYNIQADSWSQIQQYPNAQYSALQVSSMAYGWLNGEMIVAGGFKSTDFDESKIVRAYNPTTDTWRYITSMPLGKSSAGFTVTDSNKLVVTQGNASQTSTFGSTSVHILDPLDPYSLEVEIEIARTLFKYKKL